MGWAKVLLTSALAFVTVLSALAVPVTALSRSEGDYWVYGTSMDFEGIPTTGSFRVEFVEKDTLTIGSESYDVCVLRVTGSMSGETDDFMGMAASVEIAMSGYNYEVAGSLATVKDDMYMWANFTVDTGSFALTTRMETQDVTTYSPAQLSGFVEGETGTGDEWDETIEVSTTNTVWMEGVIDDTSSDEYTETYSYAIAAAEESVTTDAGTFDCLKITVTDSEGDYEVYWYSSDVGSWVKLASYSLGDPDPYFTLELTEYKYSTASDTMLILFVVLGVVAAVVVIAVIVMVMRGKGRTPVEMPPPPPPAPPGA